MPSEEEIIEEFRRLLPGTTLPSEPGRVEKVEAGLRDLMNTTDPVQAGNKAYALMRNFDHPVAGAAVCAVLNERPDGHRMICDLGAQVMQTEVTKSSMDPNNFLRGQHAINGLSKKYLEITSPEYGPEIQRKTAEIANKYDFENINNSEDPMVKQQAAISLGQEFLGALTEAELTQESMEFLKALSDSARVDEPGYNQRMAQRGEDVELEKELMAQKIVNNASVLRFGVPGMITHPQCKIETPWMAAVERVQRMVNNPHSDEAIGSKDNTPSKQAMSTAIITPENRAKVLELQEKVKSSVAPEPLGIDMGKEYRLQQKMTDLQPDYDRIARMEKQLDKLKKPSLWEHIKAIPDGGVAKKKEKLIEQIDEAKMAVHQKVDAEHFQKVLEKERGNLNQLRAEQLPTVENANAHDIAQLEMRQLQTKLGLEKTGIYEGPDTVEELDQQIQEKREILEATKQDAEEWGMLEKQAQALEKNISVRERMGAKDVEAPETNKPKLGRKQ